MTKRRSMKEKLAETSAAEAAMGLSRNKSFEERLKLADAAVRTDTSAASAQQQVSHSKVIREGFALPEADYKILLDLIDRGSELRANKSEIIRAALREFAKLPQAQLIERLNSIERLKPGRPRHS